MAGQTYPHVNAVSLVDPTPDCPDCKATCICYQATHSHIRPFSGSPQ